MGTATATPQLRLGLLAVPVAAAVLGLVAGIEPLAGIALPLALVYALIVFYDLALGVALFVAVSFLEAFSFFGGLSLAKAAGALLFLSWIAFVAMRSDARQLLTDRPRLVALLVCLGAWTLTSAVWAEDSSIALSGAQRWILNLALFPVVYSAIRTPRHVKLVCGLFVLGALLSVAYGLATGASSPAAESASRLAGSGVNPNELGELLILASALAVALGGARGLSDPLRLTCFAGAGLAVLALLATFSRGAIVGLLVALVLAPLLIGPGRRLAASAVVVVALLFGGGYLAFLAPAGDVERITQGDSTGSGRTDIWRIGVRMAKANPVVGVGVDNYSIASVHYLLEPGVITRSDFIVDEPKPAHNVYLQVLVDTGLVGLLLFLGIVVTALRSAQQAAKRFRAAGDHDMEVLARGLLIGLCGLLASAFFSTAVYSKQLWLGLSLTVVLRVMAQERQSPAAP